MIRAGVIAGAPSSSQDRWGGGYKSGGSDTDFQTFSVRNSLDPHQGNIGKITFCMLAAVNDFFESYGSLRTYAKMISPSF